MRLSGSGDPLEEYWKNLGKKCAEPERQLLKKLASQASQGKSSCASAGLSFYYLLASLPISNPRPISSKGHYQDRSKRCSWDTWALKLQDSDAVTRMDARHLVQAWIEHHLHLRGGVLQRRILQWLYNPATRQGYEDLGLTERFNILQSVASWALNVSQGEGV